MLTAAQNFTETKLTVQFPSRAIAVLHSPCGLSAGPPSQQKLCPAVNASVDVHVIVLNTATVAGATVVQIYAGGSPGMTPGITRNERVLVGYSKIRL
eukprot:COSAG05_NODE_897_length_6692_cov_5.453966_3_plen_97_part_00